MKKIIVTIILIVFINIYPQHEANQCSIGKIRDYGNLFKSAQVMYPGDSNIDVTYYKLDLSINYTLKSLTGEVTVKAKAVKDQNKNVNLDLVTTMIVSNVTSNGNNVPFTQANDLLQITLEKAYSTGELINLKIKYSGYPKAGNFGDFTFSSHNGQPLIWSLSEPYGAKAWWPSKDTPADKADSSEVWITADKSFVSISNGTLIGTIDNSDGTKTYKWKNSYPIANYLISLAMTNYQQYDTPFEYETGKFMPVNHYVFPEQFSSLKSNLDLVPGMLKIFSEKFGPYPFLKEKYGHAQCLNNVSMEHQTVSSMSTFREDVVAHELSHQWFGDKITCKDWQNIWLNEGFATYSESIYFQAKYGDTEFKNDVISNMNAAKNAAGSIYVKNISSVSEIFSSQRSYSKGGIVLHMLRGVVGDTKFFQILKQYLAEPGLAYGVATTEDFQRICERVYGQTLDYFFQEWIYGENYPKYTLGWNYKSSGAATNDVTVRITQNTNTNPAFFTMPVQIRITTDKGITNQTVYNSRATESWTITVNGTPSKVEIDPDNWILKDVVATTNILADESMPVEFSLAQNYPNPFNPETVISYKLQAASHVTLKVYDMLGREVATLVNEFKQPGEYNSQFSIFNLPSGIYFYTLQAANPSAGSGQSFLQTKKMILLK